jgi:RNA polymerase sigma factor (sigma-70 family)
MNKAYTSAEELFEVARAGDAVAMEQLLKRLQPDLRRYARRSCAADDIDEAVQDAMWVVYQRAGAIKFMAALSSWLFTIVLRICLRLKRRIGSAESFDDDNAEHAGAASTDCADLRHDLVKILGALEAPQREVLLLRDMAGYSAEETAAHLNISVQAAKSRLHRARLAVREQLHDKGSGHDIRE